jgi:hypothetical protein
MFELKIFAFASVIRRERSHGGTATNVWLEISTTNVNHSIVNHSILTSITTMAKKSLQTLKKSFGFRKVSHTSCWTQERHLLLARRPQTSSSMVVIKLGLNDIIDETTNDICLFEKLLE